MIEELAVRFYLFEVDYCQLCIVLPIRVICVVAMLVTNAYMIASFLRGIQESGSVGGTSLSTAANFAGSAIYGKLLWGEQMNGRWCLGFSCVLVGVLILSSETTTTTSEEFLGTSPPDDSNGKASSTRIAFPDVKTRIKEFETGKGQSSSSKTATTPPPLKIDTKSRIRATVSKSDIITDKVASLRTTFMNGKNRSQRFESPVTTTTARNSLARLITPSPDRTCIRTPFKSADPLPTSILRRTKKPSPLPTSPSKRARTKLRPESSLEQYYDSDNKLLTSTPNMANRSFVNECALCDKRLFDKSTGHCSDAVADLSIKTCFHLFHSSCLKQTSKCYGNACPFCEKPLAMWTASKQAAQFPGFWLEPVESFLIAMKGPPKDIISGKDKCLPASMIRAYFQDGDHLTESQKLYIQDDPTGMDRGLQAALEWGGYIDYNKVPKGYVGFLNALRTRGIWKYDSKKDDLWLWEWGLIHPRQRCDQCQLIKRPLSIECQGCRGSSEAAFYCSEICAKRDRQRHKRTCDAWKVHGPKQ